MTAPDELVELLRDWFDARELNQFYGDDIAELLRANPDPVLTHLGVHRTSYTKRPYGWTFWMPHCNSDAPETPIVPEEHDSVPWPPTT